jgi:hypothetical protein
LNAFLLHLAHPDQQTDVAFRKGEMGISHYRKTAEVIVPISHEMRSLVVDC